MSSFPSSKPQGPSRAKPSPGGGDVATVSIDPIKLLKKYAWAVPATLVIGLVLGVTIWGGLLLFVPRFSSDVTFVVDNMVDVQELGKAGRIDDDEIERFMSTQRNRMTSESTFRSVVVDNRLRERAPDFYNQFLERSAINVPDAIEELDETVRASIVQGTYAILLRVTHRDKVTAAGLATLIQMNYVDSLKAEMNRDLTDTRSSLDNSIDSLSNRLKNLNAQRQRLIRDENITILNTDQTDSSHKLDLVNVAMLEIQQEMEGVMVSLELYESMLVSDTGIQYTDTQVANVELEPAIQTFQAQLNQLKTDRKALLRQGLTPRHRTIISIDNQIAATEQELANVREDKLRKMFDAELDTLRQVSNQMSAQETDLLEQGEELSAKLVDLNRTIGEIDELDRAIEASEDEIAIKRRDLGDLTEKDPLAIGRIAIYESARVPDHVSFPKFKIVVPTTMFFFCVLVAAVIVALELLDQRVKSAADVAMIPRTRVVGVLPDIAEDPSDIANAEMVFKNSPKSVLSEHYRQLRSSVLKPMDRAGHRTLMVAGCQPGSGASSVAINLAYACSAARRNTLLIDANYRRPSLDTLTETEATDGLAEILSGINSFEPESTHTLEENLHLLTVGNKRNRMYEHLGSETMSALLAKATETYDVVILDVSPALISSDAATLANRVDASVLVVRAMSEKRGMVARLKRDLDDARGEFLGVVVNAVRSAAGGYLRKNIQAAHAYHDNVPSESETTPEPGLKSA